MAGQHSLTNIENTQNVKFIQNNCSKSRNAMISCLEYALSNPINIVLFQEPWTRDQKTISHPLFTCIMPKIATYRSRVDILFTKGNPNCNARLERILLTIPICKLLKLQLMKFEKCRFSIFITKKVKVIEKHARSIDF